MNRRRAVLTAVLILLLLLLCGLAYFFAAIVRPIRSKEPPKIAGMTFERGLYISASSGFRFGQPMRLAYTADREILCTDPDPKVNKVYRFSSSGTFLGPFSPGTSLDYPVGVAQWDDGTVWVAEFAPGRIREFDASGRSNRTFELPAPTSIDISGDRAYVCSVAEVFVLDRNGNILDHIGRGRGSRAGEYDFPHGVAVYRDGLVVADSLNARLLKIRSDDTTAWSVGGRPKGMASPPQGPFNAPVDVEKGERGYAFVLDAFNMQISIVDPRDGKVLKQVGQQGARDGQFSYPSGIAYLGGDRYAVADTYNSRIQIVRIPLPDGAVTIESGRATGLAGLVSGRRPVYLCFIPLAVLLALIALVWLRRSRGEDAEPSNDLDTGDASAET